MRRSLSSVLVVVLLSGCGGRESQIDGSLDSTVKQLAAQDPMAITIFAYRQADEHGGPASSDHQRFIRFLQDGGITVAFGCHDESGLHYALVRGRDVPRVAELMKQAKARGVPIPSMVPADTKQVDSEDKAH
jgi:hypothetical protein